MTSQRKPRAPATSRKDPVTSYAKAVVSGKKIAGPHVRDACKRHLKDIEIGHERGLVFDKVAAQRAISFFADVLRLNGGEFEGVRFELLDWQQFIVGSLYGWKTSDGYRRFRVAFVETAKGSGKSPLAAGVGMYGLVADGEARAEVYAAATKKDQAMVLFRDAVAMWQQSPDLNARLTPSGVGERVWNLAYAKAGSFFRPISADDGQSGPRPHVGLVDEVHEHKTNAVVEMLRAGTKSRRQALIFMITNSGSGKTSPCWSYHDYAAKVCSGSLVDDSFFGYVCALDEGEDPIRDEKCWPKVNPSLQGSNLPGMKYLREQVTEARGMPSKEALVRRLNFCQWTEAESPWISSDVWFSCEDKDFDVDRLLGRRCWGGLDLSSTQDLTALVLQFEPVEDDPYWRQLEWFWLPNDGLTEKAGKDRVPYVVWRDGGFLLTCPGRAINKLAVVTQCAEILSLYDLQALAYDRWRIEDLKMILDQEGVVLPLVPFGQGFKDMAPAVDEYERRLVDGQLKHRGNPVMTWNAANAVVMTDPAGNRKVAKEKATGRVDGTVAAIMATGQTIVNQDAVAVIGSDYELMVI